MGEPATAFAPLEVSYVPLDSVERVWQSQIEMIERAMSKGQGDWASSEEMLESLLEAKGQLWAIHRSGDVVAVVVISVSCNKHMTKLFVRLVAGSGISEWVGMVVENLLRMKETVGADCIEASCRPGLAKYLRSIGWSQKAIIVELK